MTLTLGYDKQYDEALDGTVQSFSKKQNIRGSIVDLNGSKTELVSQKLHHCIQF